ncbi:hypothetical protein V8E53_014118, partial [Lactarius tabidus]
PSGGPEAHKFMIRYHHNSGCPTETQHLDNHSRKLSPPCNLEPWSPFFQSCEDFKIAEVIMKLGVPKADCNRIFKAFRWCLDGWGSFNLNKYLDVQSVWKHTSSQLTHFQYNKISVPYKGENQTFEVPHHPLWNWVVDLILDLCLAPHFEWDAWKIFKHEG